MTMNLRLTFGFTLLFLTLFASADGAEPYKTGAPQEGTYLSTKIKEGTEFKYVLYIPTACDPNVPAALYVCHDGLVMVHATVMEQLAKEGAAPPVICVGLVSGKLLSTIEGGTDRSMRAEEYDQADRGYPDFLVDEFIPWLTEKYGLNISPSADMHLVGGASSGGISAWNIAWFRNDYFHRCYMSSPTFSAFRGGEELMFLARITETKPIRAYEIFGRHEPDIYAGDSYLAALMGESSMKYAGYDYKSEYFPEGGHGCGYTDAEVTERAMRFLWADWKTQPVKPLHNPERVDRLVEFGTAWEETDDAFPEPIPAATKNGVYSYEGGTLFLTDPQGGRKTVSETFFQEITGLAVSTDGWRLYIGDAARRFVYAATLLPDGTLGKIYKLAPLRLAHDIQTIGASGICLDDKDRVYAATQLGIQGIISFGITDSILPLPNHLPAEAVAFGGPELAQLYVQSGDKVFKRTMKTRGKPIHFPQTPPNTSSYFNGD